MNLLRFVLPPRPAVADTRRQQRELGLIALTAPTCSYRPGTTSTPPPPGSQCSALPGAAPHHLQRSARPAGKKLMLISGGQPPGYTDYLTQSLQQAAVGWAGSCARRSAAYQTLPVISRQVVKQSFLILTKFVLWRPRGRRGIDRAKPPPCPVCRTWRCSLYYAECGVCWVITCDGGAAGGRMGEESRLSSLAAAPLHRTIVYTPLYCSPLHTPACLAHLLTKPSH